MQSTKPLYTSIRNIPAGRLLGNADGATGPAQALGDVAARALLGLGTAALAATGDFDAAGAAASVASSLSAHVAAADPHGDRAYAASLVSGLSAVYQPLDSDLTAIAALSTTTYGRALLTLADAAAGQSALGLGNSALATVLATGTDRSVQVRNDTGNSYTDSLLTVAGTTGVASLNGSAAAYRAYGPTGVPYASLLHDGTNALLSASSGHVGVYRGSTLCAQTNNANGLNVYNRLQLMDGGSTLYGFFDAGAANPFKFGSGVMLGWANTAAASGAVDAAWERVGVNVIGINNGTSVASTGQYGSLYTGAHRVYDSFKTNYLALSHDGTEGSVNTNGGAWALRLSAGVGTITCVGGSTGNDVWRFENSTNPILRTRAGAIIGFTGSTSSATAALDTAIARRSAGAIESNNGTAGTLRDVYARTFYGIAQAATDTPGCDKGAASQSANLREWQDSTGAVLASVSENGYFTTRKNAAPADAEIATGESAYWFDSTNGAAKFMIKAKQADGTVVTGSVALA